MSSSESDSDTSYKRKKRNRSRSRSHKRNKKLKKNYTTKSRDRSSSRHSQHKTSKESRRHKTSRDISPKQKKSSSSSQHNLKKSSMRQSTPPSRRESPLSRNSKNKKPLSKSEVEKIDTKEQIKKALQAAASVDDQLRQNNGSGNGEIDFTKQRQRAEEINDIDKGDFIQSDFKSTRSEIPLPKGSQVDASHASAMFGNYTLKEDISKLKNKDGAINEIIQMMHPILLENVDEKFEKWKEKLFLMRKNFLKSNRGQLPWQIQ